MATPVPVQDIALVTADGVTAVTKAFTANVTNGNLMSVAAGRYDGGANTAFVAGDCTLSAGTATIGTVTLDQGKAIATTNPTQAGVWSAPITGSGSATMRVAGAASSYFFLQISEYSGTDVSGTRVDGVNANSSVTPSSPGTTGTVTSTGAALFVAVLAADFGAANLNPVIGGSFVSLGTSPDGTAHQTGAVARRIVSTATTDQASWTMTTTGMDGWGAALAVYKGASGGGGGRTFVLRSGLDGLSTSGPKQFNPSLG